MHPLLSILNTIPEYSAALEALRSSQSIAVTGVGQIN